jgi:hypothetical protein
MSFSILSSNSLFFTQVAPLSLAAGICEVTNDAFMADAFFKKPEYIHRFSVLDVQAMMESDNAVFIVAMTVESSPIIAGSLFLKWTISSDGIEVRMTHPFKIYARPSDVRFGSYISSVNRVVFGCISSV